MVNRAAAHLFVSGEVQGVGFRNFAEAHATALGLVGYARNLSDGRVEIQVEGEKDKIESFLQKVRQGPPRSNVTSVDITWNSASSMESGFSIRF